MGMENLTVYTDENEDPYATNKNDEDSEEDDDFNLLPTDNLIAVGHIEGDAAILEVYGLLGAHTTVNAYIIIYFVNLFFIHSLQF